MSKLLFKTPSASNPSSQTRTVSTVQNYSKSFIKLVSGTVMIFPLGKRSEDFMTGQWNLSTSFRNMVNLLPCCILFPICLARFGQHRESRPLVRSDTRSPWFIDFSSLCVCSESSLTNLIGWVWNEFSAHAQKVGLGQRSRFLVLTTRSAASGDGNAACADHVKTTGHNIKWDNFDTLAF